MNEIPEVNINEYEIKSNIGQGSFGRVYLVEHKDTKKEYAAKESLIDYDKDNIKQEFNKEIMTYSKVKSPSILRIYGYSLTNFQNFNFPVIITEYMENSSLDKYFNPALPPPAELTQPQKYLILIGIALGMKELHAHSIIHRDLKPGNILLDSNFYPYICDFGISFVSDLSASQIMMNSQVGTPLYQAPEVLSDEPYTNKVDIFSYSFIAYQLITGEPPLVAVKGKKKPTPFQQQLSIINGKRPDISKITDPEIQNFIELSWSGVPNKRPSFDLIVEEILDEKYQKFFGATDEEVDKYLSLFDDSIKNQFSASKIVSGFKKKADPDSLFQLAVMYDEGDSGIEVNKKLAIEYYRQACEIGSSDAMLIYCRKLLHGDGIPKNKEEAARIYKDFADKGNHKAMNNYGTMLLYGNGIEENKELAAYYLKKSADKGNPKAMFSYAEMLEEGDGIPMDKKLAALYYKLSADQGYNKAMLNYAEMCISGDGIEMNKKEAASYYSKFALLGDLKATFLLGIMLLIGDGIPKDKEKAAELMKSAADQGNIDAMFNYGVMLYNGDGIKMDKKEGKKYINLAADSKSKEAKNFLKNVIEKEEEKINISDDDSDDFVSPDLSKFSVYFKRLVSPLFLDVAKELNLTIIRDNTADVIFYDGLLESNKFKNFNPTQHLNKIPCIKRICDFSFFFNNLKKMKSKFPIYQGTFPETFIMPDEIDDFIDKVNESETESIPFVLKKNKSSNGIVLIDDPKNYDALSNKHSVIQQFIYPYLIDDHKFDLRVYVIVTKLKPLTLFIYKESFAFFCSEPFSNPTPENRDSYSFNKKNINSESIKSGRKIIQEISYNHHKNTSLWGKIKQISILTILSIYESILKTVKEACEANDQEFDEIDEKEKIRPFHRFYHLFGIDFIIDQNANPMVIGLNENPGMKELNEFDKRAKFELIKNEFMLMAALKDYPKAKVKNWEKILPTDDQIILSIINNILPTNRLSRPNSRMGLSSLLNVSLTNIDDEL